MPDPQYMMVEPERRRRERNAMRAADINAKTIAGYRESGVVKIPGILTPNEVRRYREACLEILEDRDPASSANQQALPFVQRINIWLDNDALRSLTLHPNVAAVAEKLAGGPLRVWHDHILAKRPGQDYPTAFHQDQPKWPHDNSPNALSVWIALQDTPVEMGCMSFLPGTHDIFDVADILTADREGLVREMPASEWLPRVTYPLRAGDCTFHHARTMHGAGPNLTDDWRVGFVVIFMDAATTYTGKAHVVTDPLGLEAGTVMDHEYFPRLTPLYDAGAPPHSR